jgi:hypothetical protein
MIEKVYTWYRDKRKLLLDYRLRKHKREIQLQQKRKEQLENAKLEQFIQKQQQQQQEDSPTEVQQQASETTDSISDEDDFGFGIYEKVEPPVTDNKKLTMDDLKEQVKKRLQSEQDVLSDPHDYDERKSSHFDPRVKQFDVLSGPANDSTIPFYLSEEKKRKVFINNKLKQYSRRNMSKTEEIRKSLQSLAHKGISASPSVTQLENPYETANVRKFRNTTQEKKKKLADLYTYSERTKEEKDEHVMKQWLSHRASDAEEQLEQIEFRDAVVSWSANRARMEEEIHRRHESLMFSSQTGLRVHKIIRKTDLEVEKERRLLNTSLKKRTLTNFLDSSSDEEEDHEKENIDKNQETKPPIYTPPSTTESSERASFLSPYNNMDEIGMQVDDLVDNSSTTVTTLQDPSALEKGFLTPNTHINIPVTSSQRFFLTELPPTARTSRGHSSGMSTSLDSSRLSTPAISKSRSSGIFDAIIRPSSTSIVHRTMKNASAPTSSASSQPKPSDKEKSTKRSSSTTPKPPSNKKTANKPATATRKDKEEIKLPEPPNVTYNITKPNFGKFLSDDKVVAHNVFEHYVTQVTKHNESVVKNQKATKRPTAPPQQQKAKAAPASRSVSPNSSRPPSSNRNTRPVPVAQQQEVPKAEPQIMQFDDLGQPPSLLHSTQIDECERIKLCLAKKRINVPSSIIERSIILPEDQPYQKCISSLPLPSVYLMDDVSLTTRRPKRPRSGGRNARTPRSIPSSRPGSSGNTSRPGTSRPQSSSGNSTSRPNSSGRVR